MWWGFIGSLDMPEYEAMRSPMSSQEVVLFWDILDLSRPWGVSRRDIQRRLRRWLTNQHCASWRDLGNTQRQARELISGPSLGVKAKLLSFDRKQSRVVNGLLTGHNTLRRHLHLLGLLDTPLCRGCGVKEETSAHILCDCETLTSLRHKHLGSFFWSRRLLRV